MLSKSFRTCEIMQRLEYLTLEQIEKGLDHAGIEDYAYILHDKDVNSDGTLKPAHWHIMLRLKNPTPVENIGKWFNISSNYVGKIHGKFADALAYLTHENVENKYKYLEEEVKSNFDFRKEIEKKVKKEDCDKRKEEIIELIQNGVIREYNYYNFITAVEFDKFKKSIDNAFRYRTDRLIGGDRKMDCYFITGASSSGKTTYAKELCKEKGYSYFVSSGSNDILDGYKGQEVIILDDLRPSCLGLSDLLKMLDNNTASSVKSRYRNKVLECKLIIITTTLNIEKFFNNVFENENESKIQLMRRCKLYIEFDFENIKINIYNSMKREYEHISTLKNKNKYLQKEDNLEEKIKFMKNALGGLYMEDDVKFLKSENDKSNNDYGFLPFLKDEDNPFL